MYLDKLTDIIRKTSNHAADSHYEWESIERDLSIVLPMDYKLYSEHFGVGKIEQYITIYHPLSKAPVSNIHNQKNIMSHTYNYLKKVKNFKYDYWDDNSFEGLFPFGMTSNGDCFYWYINDSDKKIVLYDNGLESFLELNMLTTEFIYKLLTQEIPITNMPERIMDKDTFTFREDTLWTYKIRIPQS